MIDPFNCATFSPEKKLKFIEDQIVAISSGGGSWVLCPYCGHENTPVDDHVCCKKFEEAVKAILDRLDKQEMVDFISEVQDKVS